MIKEAIGTGRTVEEATAQAREALGEQSVDIEFDVIDLPKKSFFGLKTTPARVRAFVNLPDPAPARGAERPRREPAAPRPQTRPQAPAAQPEPTAQRAPERAPAPAPAKPAAPRPQTRPQVSAAQPEPRATKPDEAAAPAEPVDPVKLARAQSYLTEIFGAMGLGTLTVTPGEADGTIVMKVEGADSAAVIGRHGETLDALQYLTGLAANRGEGSYARVTIDTGGYRERRQETLETLARRIAERVVRTGRSHTLEPMNAYERRIIHSAVGLVKGADSVSVGEEPMRKVVISSKRHGAGAAPESGPVERREAPSHGGYAERSPRAAEEETGDRREAPHRGGYADRSRGGDHRGPGGRDRNAGGGRPRRERPEPYKASSTREVAPAEAENKPLYGKVEI